MRTIEELAALIEATKTRHKAELDPLKKELHTARMRSYREAGKTQRKVETLADKIAAGLVVYSRDPAEIAQGATPMWEMREDLRFAANLQRAAAGFPPLDFSNPHAAAPSEPEHDPEYQELLRLEAEAMARGDG